MKRDNYQCQYPGCSVKDKLEVHHIKKFATYKHLRTALFNGITLCEAHHSKIFGREEHYEVAFFKIVQGKMNAEVNRLKDNK